MSAPESISFQYWCHRSKPNKQVLLFFLLWCHLLSGSWIRCESWAVWIHWVMSGVPINSPVCAVAKWKQEASCRSWVWGFCVVYKFAFFWRLSDYNKATATGQPETRSQPDVCQVFILPFGWSSRKLGNKQHFTGNLRKYTQRRFWIK